MEAKTTKKIEERPVLDVATKNKIQKEIKQIYDGAKVKMSTINTGSGFAESVNGKMKVLSVDMGTRYGISADERDKRLSQAFSILEKYNREYKFDYTVDKKKYKSDNTNFVNNRNSIFELF